MLKQKRIFIASWLCVTILIVTSVPLLATAFYNHPCNDDYTFSLLTKAAWEDTHSLWEVAKAAVQQARLTWHDWQGTWAAVVIFALQPAIFGEGWYVAGTFLLLGSLVFSIFYFFHGLLGSLPKKELRVDADRIRLIAGLISLVCVQMMPSPVQGLYWWNGASYYVVFFSLLLVQAINLMLLASGKRRGTGWTALCALLGAIVSGGNFITALLGVELTVLFFVYTLMKRKPVRIRMGIVLTAALAGFFLSVLAPGNAVRQAQSAGLDPIRAVVYSFRQANQYLSSWFTPLMLSVALMLLPLLCGIPVERMVRRKIPFLPVLGLMLCFFASAFTPQLFGMGLGWAELRVVNVWFFLFWIMLVLVLLAAIHAARIGMAAVGGERCILKGAAARRLAIGAAACALVFAAITAVLDRASNPYAGLSALRSLATGEAQAYHAAHLERLALLERSGPETELPSLPCEPHVLYMDDIREDPTFWVNEDYAAYYGKKAVWTAPAPDTET